MESDGKIRLSLLALFVCLCVLQGTCIHPGLILLVVCCRVELKDWLKVPVYICLCFCGAVYVFFPGLRRH